MTERQEARSVSICGDDLQLCKTVVLIVSQKSEVSAQSLVLLEQLCHEIDPISDMESGCLWVSCCNETLS